jgi:hypothetical protein
VRSTAPVQVGIAPGKTPQDLSKTTWTDPATPGPWSVAISSNRGSIDELYIILTYTLV